jgi:dienelactone hydrolase
VGALLKWQKLDETWPSLSTLEAYRVMFVSRGALGQKVFETGMVYIPAARQVPKGGRPVVAWGHGTSGVSDSSAPSRYPWLYPGTPDTAWGNYADLVGRIGDMGYVVACPDYEGLGTPGLHTYLNATSEGHAMIDSVRAARRLASRMGVRTSRTWVATGHSQGGWAALAAAEQASTYGAGLSLQGAIDFSGGQDVAGINTASSTLPFAWAYVGWVAWGIKAVDPSFDVTSICGPWLISDVQQAKDLFYDEWFALLRPWFFDANGIPAAPQPGDVLLTDWDQSPAAQKFLAGAAVGTAPAQGTLLLIQADDMGLPFFFPMLNKLQGQGDDVRYVILPPGTIHDDAITVGWPDARAFLQEKLPVN